MLNLAELYLQLTKLTEVSSVGREKTEKKRAIIRLEDFREGLSPIKRPTHVIASILASKSMQESRQDNPLIK